MNFFLSLLISYALLGAVSGGLELFAEGGVRVLSGFTWKAAAVTSALLLWRQRKSFQIEPSAFGWALVFLLVTEFPNRKFHFYPQLTSVHVLLLGAISWGLLCSVKHRLHWPLLLVSQIAVLLSFFSYVQGELIFSDDHPSFLYRLELLRRHFPQIPFYNTDWNAGYSAREFLPTGALNFFLLASPLLLLSGGIHDVGDAWVYNVAFGVVFIVLIPWSVYFGAKLLRCLEAHAVIAALLALGPSLGFFEWLLRYGTLGFSVSCGLAPFTFALLYRFVQDERPTLLLSVGAACSLTLCLFWSLSCAFFLPLFLTILPELKNVFARQRRNQTVLFIGLLLAMNLPWMVVFIRESKVFEFLQGSSLPGAKHPTSPGNPFAKLASAHKSFKSLLGPTNPLLLVFLFPGLFLLPQKRLRLAFAGTVAFLLALGCFGSLLKPQLELKRMVYPALFFGCIPAALAIHAAFSTLRAKPFLVSFFPLAALLGAAIATPASVAAFYRNGSEHRYILAGESVSGLSNAINAYGGGGRTVFLGFILHELGGTSQDGGHIAPLPIFSRKPLYASDFYHAKWSAIDPIPPEFRKEGPAGIERFLDLVNATAVVTFRREWADYCASQANYRQVYSQGRFRVFIRETSPTYVLRGAADVVVEQTSITVTPRTPEIVLKFRHLPRLRVSDEQVQLTAEPMFEEEVGAGKRKEVSYIRLQVPFGALGKPVTIRY